MLHRFLLCAGMALLALPAVAAEPAGGSVARAVFTSQIKDREPVDALTTVKNDVTHIHFFTELKGLAGQKVTHRWEYQGQTKLEVSFDVGADRWRVFSNKNLLPSWLGEWKVSVIDDGGRNLGGASFTYTGTP